MSSADQSENLIINSTLSSSAECIAESDKTDGPISIVNTETNNLETNNWNNLDPASEIFKNSEFILCQTDSLSENNENGIHNSEINIDKLSMAEDGSLKSKEILNETSLDSRDQNNLNLNNLTDNIAKVHILEMPMQIEIDIQSVLVSCTNNHVNETLGIKDCSLNNLPIENSVNCVQINKDTTTHNECQNFNLLEKKEREISDDINSIIKMNPENNLLNNNEILDTNQQEKCAINSRELGSKGSMDGTIQNVDVDQHYLGACNSTAVYPSGHDLLINDLKTALNETIPVKEKLEFVANSTLDEINVQISGNDLNDAKSGETLSKCTVDEDISCVYHLKWITFNSRKLPIITQNENGPCPLLAICNLLLLRGNITIPAETMLIESSRLLSYLTDYIFDCIPRNISADNRLNYEQNMNDAIAIFPKLQTGLDVNVRFTGVSHFEFTTECIVFDLLNIPLYHGWLVDPTDNVATVIGTLSYNQLVEKIICQKNIEELCGDALLAEDFLYRSASQMTYHGLCELNSTIKNDEMAILFRNNHFHTLYKHKEEMYVLATDQGFLNESQVVWESLSNIEGDSIFLDGNLKPFNSSNPVVSDPNQIDRDFQLALSLQDDAVANLDFEEIPWQDNSLITDHELALRLQAEEEKNLKADHVAHYSGAEETSVSAASNLSTGRSGVQLHSSSSTSDVQRSIPTSQSRRSVAAGPIKKKKVPTATLR